MIPLFDLNYNEEEIKAVTEVIRSKWISMGAKVMELEEKFANMIGAHYAAALSNCTAALHLAMIILDIKQGDEVILPSLTFVATGNAIRYVGATPVFADVSSLDDWTISVEDIEKKITSKTKALIVMHYAGFSADMDKIKSLAKRYNLAIIEDACHAPGSTWKGQKVGTKGDVSCYSFYSNKNISTGEGGMLVTNDPLYVKRAMILRSHGMTMTAHSRKEISKLYDVIELGYNYRMDDMRASLGLVQLEKLPDDIQRRNKIARRYRSNLKSLKCVKIPFSQYDGISSYYIFPILVEGFDRQFVMDELLVRGIQTSYHYPPVHCFKIYQNMSAKLPLTEKIAAHCISLPMFGSLSDEDVDYICQTLTDILKEESFRRNIYEYFIGKCKKSLCGFQ
jgi:dTDP-4-amino-4,6-dideoxygalactose transaminase